MATQAHTTRRAVFGGIAGAVLSTNDAATAPAGGADTVPTALSREHEALLVGLRREEARFNALRVQYEATKPAKPEPLRCRPDDRAFLVGEGVRLGEIIPMDSVERLRNIQGYDIPSNHRRPEALSRAQQIVTAYDKWLHDCDWHYDVLGLNELDNLLDSLCEQIADLENKILATRAATMVGVAVTDGAVVLRDSEDGTDEVLWALMGEAA